MISVLTQRALKFTAIQLVKAQDWLAQGKRPEPQIYYFAYGANLKMARFEKYRMNVRPEGVASVEDFELAFTLPCEYAQKGFGSIHEKKGATVWGYLYRIDRLSLWLLDIMEWAVMGQYHRIEVDVQTRDGRTVKATAYQAKHPRWDLYPSKIYRDLIAKAAEEHDFPPNYRLQITSVEAREKFSLDPAFSFLHPPKPRWFASQLRALYLAHDRFREKVCDWLKF